ncbi:MAG: hypothetical protein ACXV8U_15385, partial [Methylobacter sp.]
LLNELGVYFDALNSDDIVITIKPKAQQMVIDALADETNRRSDRKKMKRTTVIVPIEGIEPE